jgi:membrane-bound ClpP family serine protease
MLGEPCGSAEASLKASAFILYSCWLCCASSSGAMEFAPFASRAGIAIKATGAIEIGDAAKLQQVIHQASVDEKGLRRIILESPGGKAGEAMLIAKLIRANNFITLVGGECASACAMILYPAGRYFMLLDGGKLGFHSCYDSRSLVEQPECTKAVAEFAASNGFPYGSIKIFASLAGPAEMYWVTNVLAYCYGMERFIGNLHP